MQPVPRARPASARRIGNAGSYALILPVAALVVATLLVPLTSIFASSLTTPDGSWSLQIYRNVATTEVYRVSIVNTVVMSAQVALICLVFGYGMAYRMARDWSAWAGALIGLLILSFWTGLLIRTFAWMIILGSNGALASAARFLGLPDLPQMLYNRTGAIIGMVNIMLPYMVLTLYAVMRRIDPGLMNSAASLGATPLRAFWRVYVPLTLPGVWAGLLLVFVVTIGFYITPELLGGPRTVMISQVVARVVQQLLDFKLAGALSLVLLAVTFALLAVYNRLVGSRGLGGLS